MQVWYSSILGDLYENSLICVLEEHIDTHLKSQLEAKQETCMNVEEIVSPDK
jgi:hypothetical protein